MHKPDQTLELLLGQLQPSLLAVGLGHTRIIFRRKCLQVETALAGTHLHALVRQFQAYFRTVRQRSKDVLKFSGPHGNGGFFRSPCTCGVRSDLDLDIGGQQSQLITAFFDQDVGQNGQGVTLLDDAANRLKRSQDVVTFCFNKEHI